MRFLAEHAALALEAVGVTLIVAISVFALLRAAVSAFRSESDRDVYSHLRRQLGRGILLGLEFLVAADIIHTVAVNLAFKTVGILGLIVLIRTFLSFTREVEITSRWPWQSRSSTDSDAVGTKR
jgi:uncharacterized membrane protein